jgi:hypothetical protein
MLFQFHIECVSLCVDFLKSKKGDEINHKDLLNPQGKIFNINKSHIELEDTNPLLFFEVAGYIKVQLEAVKIFKYQITKTKLS